MKKQEAVAQILAARSRVLAVRKYGKAFAPTNIALCKYWGKREAELNLPQTSSLSISLGQKGANCMVQAREQGPDSFTLNGKTLALLSSFGRRLTDYLDLFRGPVCPYFYLDFQFNIPFAAGLASSAAAFAALALALDELFDWKLDQRELSILARLGSGSACRSITPGFVEWQAGSSKDGMDSYGAPLTESWPELCIGLLMIHEQEKPLSSREAMERTRASSPLYAAWPGKVEKDLALLKRAITQKDFQCLGETAESNALSMHALMLSAWPPISYTLPETLAAMQKLWRLRQEGAALYFTQDAGPNLKLLFLKKDQGLVQAQFPGLEVLQPQYQS